MDDAFIGEIRIFGGNFAPRDWLLCIGGEVAITEFTMLYAVIGTTYGGNGRTTLGIPDLRSRAPMHVGASQGPGLRRHFLGEMEGFPDQVVTTRNLPSHQHDVQAVNDAATTDTPSATVMLAKAYRDGGPLPARTKRAYTNDTSSGLVTMNEQAVGPSGNPSPLYMNNYQPYLGSNFIICHDGIFPPRS